jgi:primosomal protein N'
MLSPCRALPLSTLIKRNDPQKLLTELIANINSIKHVKKIRWSLDVDPVDLF